MNISVSTASQHLQRLQSSYSLNCQLPANTVERNIFKLIRSCLLLPGAVSYCTLQSSTRCETSHLSSDQPTLFAMTGGKFNVGIIGYGLSAKTFHIPFVSAVPDFNFYAIVQRSPKPNDDASKDHPGIKLYHSVEDLVGDAQVDVVIVTTAPDSHLRLAKLALQAKKHGGTLCCSLNRLVLIRLQLSSKSPSRQHLSKHRNWRTWPNLKVSFSRSIRTDGGIRIS